MIFLMNYIFLGKWGWGNKMDQVVVLLRNPRWAIPSYHNMRFELDYSKTWAESYARIGQTYTERPEVEQWENWRDGNFDGEMNRWFNFLDFWMKGGYQETDEEGNDIYHSRCRDRENFDCFPKAVLDFDHFYQRNPTAEFVKIADVFESSGPTMEMVAAQARTCVLEQVFDNKNAVPQLHQKSRPNAERPPMYRLTVRQFDRMLNRTIELVEKYSTEPYSLNPEASEFVRILGNYIIDNEAEYQYEVSIYLEEFVEIMYGTINCNSETLSSTDQTVCAFMKNRHNHDVFHDGYVSYFDE